MKMTKGVKSMWGLMGVILTLVIIASLACSSEEAPTPRPAARPQPTAVPAATQPPSGGAMGQPVYGGTLRYVGAPTFKTTDPAFAVGDPITLVHYLLHNQIVRLGTNMDILPELAESWQIGPDNKSVTFQVRRGVTFQDGTLFTAESVKYNLDRCLDVNVPCISKTKIEQISSIDVLDDYTVRVNLKNQYRPILAALAEIAGFMASPTAIEKYNSYDDNVGDYGKFPTGTGPFVMSEWIPERKLLLTKFDNYWEPGKPYLDAIEFIPLPEGTSGIAMLRTGETDIMEISPREIPLLADNPNVKTVGYDSGRTYHFQLNAAKAPLDNVKLRQAMAYAMDRQTFIDTVFAGEGRPAYSIVGQGFAFDPSFQDFKFDLQKAKSLLAEAGFANGVDVDIMCRTSGIWIDVCEAFQAMMAPAGINMKIDATSRAAYTPRRANQEFTMLPSYRTPLGDVHLLIGELYQAGGRGNYILYQNSEVDKLLLKAGGLFDLTEANAIYKQVQRLIAQDVPAIYYMWSTEYVAMNVKVGNFERTPDLDLKLRDLWMEN